MHQDPEVPSSTGIVVSSLSVLGIEILGAHAFPSRSLVLWIAWTRIASSGTAEFPKHPRTKILFIWQLGMIGSEVLREQRA